MARVWFTSDYHLGHRNIIHLCERPFEDVEPMDRTIVEGQEIVLAHYAHDMEEGQREVAGGFHPTARLTGSI